jgi:Na+-translocating ferredoxin:NAD+ oxidoreductase RnfG subunit
MKRWKREKTMGFFLQWRWASELSRVSLCLVCALVLLIANASAEEIIKIDDALRRMFPDALELKPRVIRLSLEQIQDVEGAAHVTFADRHTDQITLYVAQKQNIVLGYAIEDTVMGKWGPIHYLVGLDTQGVISQVIVLDYQEIRGRPIAKKRFLKQYQGKGAGDHLELHKDIDGVTGATISSRSLTDGVRKLVHIFQEIGRL